MEDYFKFEGRQSVCSKICMIAHHRIILFYRDASQWVALLIPILFVTMMAFIFYSLVKVIATGQNADVDRIVPLMLKVVFGFFLTIGSTFTAGMSANLPMEEKKGGLRHMMHLFGLNSLQYWTGTWLGDALIVAIPPTVIAVVLLVFDDIMERHYVPEFFILFWMFGNTLNTISYLFSHIFSSPETGIKYISLIYSLGFLIGPLVLWSIFASLLGGTGEAEENPDCKDGKDINTGEDCRERTRSQDDLMSTGYSVLFYASPLFTFWVSTLNITYRDNKLLEPWLIFGAEPAGLHGSLVHLV